MVCFIVTPLRTPFTYSCLGKCGFVNSSLIKDSRHIRPLVSDAIFTPNVRIKGQDDDLDFGGKAHGLADNFRTYYSFNAVDEPAKSSGISWDGSSDFVDPTVADTNDTPDSSDTTTGDDGFEAAANDTSDGPEDDGSDDLLNTIADSFDTGNGPVDNTSASAIGNGFPNSFDTIVDDSPDPSDDVADFADASGGADLIDDNVDSLNDVDSADGGGNLDPDDGAGIASNGPDDGTSFIDDSGKNSIFCLHNDC